MTQSTLIGKFGKVESGGGIWAGQIGEIVGVYIINHGPGYPYPRVYFLLYFSEGCKSEKRHGNTEIFLNSVVTVLL